MTTVNATRAAIVTGLLLASGLATPAQAQSETRTVQERVVVTLPNGKRIVRVVEKQVPVTPAASVDPFAGYGGSDGGSGNNESRADNGDGDTATIIDPLILEWIGWYRTGDMRADANGDGRVTAADFNAYLMLLNDRGDDKNDDKNSGNSDDPGDDNSDDNTGDGSDGNSDDSGDDNSDDTTDDGAGSNDTNGWTELVPASDSRVFYVAENGSDSNDGLSPDRALRTVNEGIRRLRDGSPDWLLLRRGDTFSESLGSWNKSGRSESQKMVIGAYGEGPRPVLLTGTGKGLSMIKRDRRAHLAFVSLELRPGVKYRDYGIRMVSGGVEDVLMEDLLISGYTHGIALHGDSSSDMRDIEIRRCVIIDNAGTTHAQGLFADKVDGILVVGCIFDRNGWEPGRGRDATATIFAHNVYMQRTVKNLEFRDNFSSRASSHGIQARLGGDLEGNVFWSNPIGVMFGNEGVRSDEPPVQGSINNNIVLEGIHQNDDHKRGWGIQVQHADGVEVRGNIVANSTVGVEDGFGYGIMLFSNTDAFNKNLVISDNVVDDFGRNIRVDEDEVLSVTIRGNLISMSGGSRPLVQHDEGMDVPGLVYEANRYLHKSRTEEFSVGNSQLELTEWQADFDPRGGSMQPGDRNTDPYKDGSATLDDYARSVGFSGDDAFIDAMRNQRKGAWDSRLNASEMRDYFSQQFTLRNPG